MSSRTATPAGLASIGAEITRAEQALERYYEGLRAGQALARALRRATIATSGAPRNLGAQEAERSLSTPDEAGRGPTPADLAAVADQLERVIAEAAPQKTKAPLRLLIQELLVEGRAQIQPTYRLVTPEVCATSQQVERTGIEPVTSGLQSRSYRSATCMGFE